VSSPFHKKCAALLQEPSVSLYICTKTISEYFAVCSKLNIEFSKSVVFYQTFCRNSTILFPDAHSLFIFEGLVSKYNPKGNRVYDIEIASIALAHEINEIATLNVADFSGISEIKVLVL
jgi:predicted nucleic acid-binding protein